MDEYHKLTKMETWKKLQVLSKSAKIRDIKLKSIPLLLETMQCPISKPLRRLPGLWNWKNWKNDENFQKLEKMRICTKKIAKICDIQKLKPIPWQLKVFQ